MKELEMVAELLAKPEPSAATVAAGRRRLQREAEARRPRRILVFGGLGGLTALVAGGVAAVVLASGGGRVVPAEQNATSILLAAAERAETTPPQSGRYWYIDLDFRMRQDLDRPARNMGGETWRTVDGRTWVRSKNGPRKLMRLKKSKFSLCDKEVTYQQILDLPTEPDALRAEVGRAMLHNDDGPVPVEEQGQFLTSCMISLITGTPAPPRIRAAAFRSLAGMPQTRRLGVMKDGAGRPGTALLITNGDTRDRLIIDTASATVLESERVIDHPRHGRLVQTTTVRAARWTDVPPA